MFSQLKSQSPIYILFRTSPMRIENAIVESVTAPVAKFPTTFGQVSETTIDIVVNLGGDKQTFQKIPTNMDTATFVNQNISLFSTREAVNNELKNIRKMSEDVVNSYEFHTKQIANIDELYLKVNPEIEEKKRQDEVIAKLLYSVDSLTKKVEELTKANSNNSRKNKDSDKED